MIIWVFFWASFAHMDEIVCFLYSHTRCQLQTNLWNTIWCFSFFFACRFLLNNMCHDVLVEIVTHLADEANMYFTSSKCGNPYEIMSRSENAHQGASREWERVQCSWASNSDQWKETNVLIFFLWNVETVAHTHIVWILICDTVYWHCNVCRTKWIQWISQE